MIKWTSLKIYSDEYLRSLTSKKGWSKIHQTSKKENGPIGVESHTSPYIETPILCMGRLKNMLTPINTGMTFGINWCERYGTDKEAPNVLAK